MPRTLARSPYLVALALTAAVLSVPLPVEARGSSDRSGSRFHATGEYDVSAPAIAGTPEVLFSRRAAAYVLSFAGHETAFLLRQRDRTVTAFPATALVRDEHGLASLVPGTRGRRLGRFALAGNDVVIALEELRARLTPCAALLGSHDRAGVLAHSPQYATSMRAYRLDTATIDALRTSTTPVEVEVFFGSWCPRCQQLLGNMLAVDAALAGTQVTFSYYGLPKPPAAWRESHYRTSGVRGLPGAVVRVYGRNRGVIDHRAWTRVEAQILSRIRS